MRTILTFACLLLAALPASAANFPYIRLNGKTNVVSDNGTNLTYNGTAVGGASLTYAGVTNAMSWSGNTNLVIGGDGHERTAPTTVTTNFVAKTGDTMTGPLVPASYTVATLPASSSGAAVWCSDALTPWGSGTVVYYDGSVWRGVSTKIRATASVPQFMYYAYADSQWTGASPQYFATILDDAYVINNGYWNQLAQHSGVAPTYGGTDNLVFVRCATGAETNGNSSVFSYLFTVTGGGYMLASTSAEFLSLSSAADSFYAILGYDSAGNGIPTVHTRSACFFYDPQKASVIGAQISANTNNWHCVTGEASTYTVTDSGVAATSGTFTDFHQFTILVTSTTNAVFYIDGVARATNTTNVPNTGTLGFVAGIQKAAGTTSRQLDLDWIYSSKYYGTARNFR